MRKNNPKKEVFQFILLTILISMIGGFIQIHLAKQMYYQDMSRLVGGIINTSPEAEKQVMQVLKEVATSKDKEKLEVKEENQKNELKGNEILKRYGYTKSKLFSKANRLMGTMMIVGMFVIGLALLYMHQRTQKNTQRIEDLTRYLKASKEGQSKSLLIGKEDMFSKLEDEIYKTVGELYQTRKTAWQEKDILKEHIADIAHQFKTPLASMGMMCELLADVSILKESGTLKESVSEESKALEKNMASKEARLYITQLQGQLERLDSLVYSLIHLSQLEANVVQMEKKPVSVYILILRVLELLELPIKTKNLSIEIEPKEDETIIYEGDMKWSIEAIHNLIKNCIEHTPEGSKIRIYYEKAPLFTQIIIEDEGKGFEPEDIPHLFQRFYKGKNATKDSVGIGLALANTIIEKQNGLIEAENREDGGARFRIKIYPCH